MKAELKNPHREVRSDVFKSGAGQASVRNPAGRWLPGLLGLCAVWLAWRCVGGQAPLEASTSSLATSVKLAAGRTEIPPLSGQAAKDQAKFCAHVGAELSRVPLETGVFADPKLSSSSLHYRLFKPAPLDRAKVYPLVIYLHGGGAQKSFADLLKCSSPVFAFGPARLVSPGEQAHHPAFVLVPWSGGRGWEEENTRLIVGLLESLRHQRPVDPKRFYITGQSMGGYGVWRMISLYPDLFTAAIPVCGGGDVASIPKAKTVPVWAFHGSADGLVPVSETRHLIDALLRAGGRPVYWEYTGDTHAKTVERAYGEPKLLDWLFAQSRP